MGRRTDGWTRTDEGVQIPEKVLFHLGQIPSCRFPIERIRTRSLKLGCLSQNCRGGLISQVSELKSLWTFFLPARQSKQIVPSSNRTVGGHSSISFHSTQSMDFAHPVQYCPVRDRESISLRCLFVHSDDETCRILVGIDVRLLELSPPPPMTEPAGPAEYIRSFGHHKSPLSSFLPQGEQP